MDELIKILNPESNYVFYDDAHGFCINTQDVLDHLCAMQSAQLAQDLTNGCTDTISREAAIEAMRKAKDKSELHRMLVQLPSAQPGWIPCSERLPGKDESFYVLCCDKYGEIMIGNVFECYDGETPYSAESENEYMYDCVAWMPLPTPYREGGQS